MHDFFGDRYHFFMRADDDVLVNVPAMKRFLHRLNSSRPLFLGQTGVGSEAEFGRLALQPHSNFCMGGPGVVLSRTTLAALAANTARCLGGLRSGHEDVELGRCVRRAAGVSCTWSYDMQVLLEVLFVNFLLLLTNFTPYSGPFLPQRLTCGDGPSGNLFSLK